MRIRLLALGVALVLYDPPSAQAQPRPPPRPAQLSASGGIYTDRLSRKELKTWSTIVAIVMAEGPGGHPLYPTLRALWDTVDSSPHTVYVELRDRRMRRSYIGGHFMITKVDPEGRAHSGILILNLRAINNASTGSAARRANGFVPFEGLGRKERYAEVLGHELAHAAWSLADTERARLVERLQGELERQMPRLLAAQARGIGAEIQKHVDELDRLSRVLEEPAEEAEVHVWRELRAGQQR